MNDHLNETPLPEDGLSADELSLLREALATAWPPPEHSIRDGVMAQIRKERAAAKRRQILSRAVKYGSLAACLVLITAVGIRVLPSLGRSSDMAAEAYITIEDYAAPQSVTCTALSDASPAENTGETLPETAADSTGAHKLMAVFPTSEAAEEMGSEAPAEDPPAEMPEPEEAAPAETVPETAAPMLMFAAAPKSDSADDSTDAEIPECEAVEWEAEEVYSEKLADLSASCGHISAFADSYHTIPDLLIACTGEDIYLAWLEGTEGCAQNIAGYLNYMEANSHVLLSDIEMIYDATDLWYQLDWNFDLFESGDAAAIEEYYRNGGDFAGMVKRESEYRFKLALLDETGAEKSVDVCAWSIADLVEEEAMTLSVLTAVYEASADQVRTDYPGYEVQQYDLAALHDYAYSAENDEPTPPGSIAPGRHEDEMFRVDAVK